MKTPTALKKTQKRHGVMTRGRASALDRKIRVQPRKRSVTNQRAPHTPEILALELFQPNPNMLYSLDAIAHLAGVSRHSILVYCRAGLVRPVIQPPYDALAFTGEAIHTVRRIQHVQATYGTGVTWIKTIFLLLDELEHLRSEVRVLRAH